MMRIWYEIEDALETSFEDVERDIHQECRFEVWEWCSMNDDPEATLVGRFCTRRLAELFITQMEDEVAQSGRGVHYPQDARQKALDAFHMISPGDSTIH